MTFFWARPRRLKAAWLMAGLVAIGLDGVARAEPLRADAFDVSQYKGSVVYLDFWASWCGPCKLSFPYMKEMKANYERRGLIVVAVNVDHDQQRAKDFLNKAESTLDVVYDSQGKIAQSFNVREMPTSVLIDRNGKVRFVHTGFHQEQMDVYDAQLAELLSEKQ